MKSATDDQESTRFKRCWTASHSIHSAAGVSADDELAYFVDQSGKVIGVELATGRVAWTAEVGGKLLSELVVANGRAYAIAEPGDQAAKPVLRVLSTKTGLPLWNIELPRAGTYFLTGSEDDLAVVATMGTVWLLDTATGMIRWTVAAGGSVLTPPRIEGERLLIAFDKKRVDEFSLKTGEKIASAQVEGEPAFVGAGKSSAAVYSDERGNVHSIQMGGAKNWKFRAGGKVVYIRSVDGNVLLGSVDNFVYFMSIEYGNLLWKRRLPGRVANGVLIGPELAVFTVIGDKAAYILELDKGRLVDKVELTADDDFLMTPIRANGKYLIAATVNGLSAYSGTCAK